MKRNSFMCRNRLFILSMTFSSLFLFTCCNRHFTGESTEEEKDTAQVSLTVFGTCGDGSSMNTLEFITDDSDTLNLELVDAYDTGKVFGGYAVGDRMAVVLNPDSTKALLVINETTMAGTWMLAGNGKATVRIDRDGSMTSCGMPVNYSSWSIVNGKLVLERDSTDNDAAVSVNIRKTSGGQTAASINCRRCVFEILKLDADSFVYSDTDDTTRIYRYVRKM
ncbi:lipocalin family protein [Xylanibacter muris]|uniref:Lipocalin-like domain-containing protein n=1 Tax=Xylanibacter muris TaxID=2736290 RepID=A0ABX2AQX3_9BACT|nr:lipocalin family protein [Xylanibacter muris]NPD92351.1 hypothetical protein [Xylanibacter muris]